MDGKITARGRYDRLASDRLMFLERARECSRYTIPYLIPEEGHTSSTRFHTPYAGLPAQAVNNLAAKLLTTLLPPGAPFFKLNLERLAAEQAAQVPAPGGSNLKSVTEEQLLRTELIASDEVEGMSLRPKAYELFRHLIVGGNALLFEDGEDSRVHPLSNFVCHRDGKGHPVEIIIKAACSYYDLEPLQQLKVRDFTKEEEDQKDMLDIYTSCTWNYETKKWDVYQEINGHELPDTRGTYTKDNFPYIPLRWNRIDGEDYGRGYVEEYLGDIISLEELSKSIVQGSAVASRIIYLVEPGGVTNPRELEEAENGAYVKGNVNEVNAVQSQKSQDLRIAAEMVSGIEAALKSAFLMVSSVQRQAERVTAEEIRLMANELENALGGIYSLLGQEFQRPLVERILSRLKKQKKIPALPDDLVDIQVITGLEALGRGQDLQRLQVAIGSIPQPLLPEVLPYLDATEMLNRIFGAVGVDTAGLLKDPEQVAAERQQAQMQQMAEKLGPQAIQQAGAMAQAQQQEQPQ